MTELSISLTLLAYLYSYKVLCILLSCVFIVFFEISIGPIMWLYIAEIMTPRGAGFAYGLNWIFVIIFALVSSLLFKEGRQQNSYLGLSIFCCVGIFFILHFVRETKGLSPYKCKKLYFPKNFKSAKVKDINPNETENERFNSTSGFDARIEMNLTEISAPNHYN